MTQKKFKPHDRRRARRYALQALYQWLLSGSDLIAIEQHFLSSYNMDKVEVEYLAELLHGIPKQLKFLDDLLTPFLDRKLSELNPIELISLRIGAYELSQRIDIPYKVAINEAVELTKSYGTVDGYKYVNAVLDQLALKIRPHERGQPDSSN